MKNNVKNDAKDDAKYEKDFSTRLMAFTFFYAVSLYLLCIGYHYWDKHIDIKREQETKR